MTTAQAEDVVRIGKVANGDEFQRRFGTCVTAHAWNADCSLVAICPNSPVVEIYETKGWTCTATLEQHDQIVTAIDWAPKSNRIVTSSQDRNAYVWNPKDDGSWDPVLVLLRLSRAATCVKWSPQENKFAVGSGEKSVCVCQFMADFGATGGWTSKLLKKPLKSTVLSVGWHPNNCWLIVGSADMKARVFNAWLKDVDGRKSLGGPGGPFGLDPTNKKVKFGTCIAEYGSSKGWVHDAQFSPSGTGIAFVGHDSSCHFVPVPTDEVEPSALPLKEHPGMQTIKTKGLPYKAVKFLEETKLIAAGHDATVDLFEVDGDKWTRVGMIEKPDGAKKAAKKANVRNMWEQKVDQGGVHEKSTKNSIHQNSIAGIELMSADQFSTCGYDGRVVVWANKILEEAK